MRTWKFVLAIAVATLVSGVGLIAPLSAQEVIQGYDTALSLERGTVVSLEKDAPNAVVPTSANTLEDMYGVVVNANDAPLTISSEGQQTFVTTSGQYEVLVSNESGLIEPGDYITVGSLDGIGIKAGKGQSTVLGKAVTGFDGSNNVVSNLPISDEIGERQVAIGRVVVAIHVANNPLVESDINIPNFLKRTAESIVNKQVSTPRLYASFVVLITTMGVVISMLYAGIRSGIISIGRNPLSQKTITKGLLQVLAGSMFIFIAGLFAVYLLLKL